MNKQDAENLRADFARLNQSLHATLDTKAFHQQMAQMRKAHEDSFKQMSQSMDAMRKSIDASFDRARKAYRKTPEYKRMNDEMTARTQWMVVPIAGTTLVALGVILTRFLL